MLDWKQRTQTAKSVDGSVNLKSGSSRWVWLALVEWSIAAGYSGSAW